MLNTLLINNVFVYLLPYNEFTACVVGLDLSQLSILEASLFSCCKKSKMRELNTVLP